MPSAYGRLPLNALRVFEAVATRLNFAEAAEALGVTPAAVSQQIKVLEEYLQAPVLRRKGRSVELTPEGAQLLPGVRCGLDALISALRGLRLQRATGSVNISTLASLMQKWLAPRLPRLHDALPELQVEWHTSREAVDFGHTDFHAAVRFGRGRYPGLEAEKLMDEWLVVVAAPEVIERHGPLDGRKDLAGLPLLQAKDEPWSHWQGDGERLPWPAGPSIIDDSVSVLAAAAEGMGYVPARWSLVAHDLQRGRLALASERIVASRYAYWFVCPGTYAELPKIAALRDWLRAEAAAFEPPAVATPRKRGKKP